MSKRHTKPQAYENQAEITKALVKGLGVALKAHTKESASKPKHWGYVGDLGHANEQLLEVLMWLTAEDNPAKLAFNENEDAGRKELLRQALQAANRNVGYDRNGNPIVISTPK